MSNIVFSADSWVTNGKKMTAASQDLTSAVNSFVSEVSDPSVFGNNDMVGGVAAMIYGLIMERMAGCLETLAEGYGGHGQLMAKAGETYRELEADQTAASSEIQAAI